MFSVIFKGFLVPIKSAKSPNLKTRQNYIAVQFQNKLATWISKIEVILEFWNFVIRKCQQLFHFKIGKTFAW